MKFFLDTAQRNAIKRWHEVGLLNGVTTNPSHLSKEKEDPLVVVKDICSLVKDAPVSVEVTETEPQAVYLQARRIADIAQNIVVKIPCAAPYISVIHRLVKEDVTINVTLVFSVVQGLCMAKLGVTYISPFIGRLDDIDCDGMQVIEDLRMVLDQYHYESKILAASVRSVRQVHQAALCGADIVTIPPSIFDQALNHPLSEKGMAQFLADWHTLGVKQFP